VSFINGTSSNPPTPGKSKKRRKRKQKRGENSDPDAAAKSQSHSPDPQLDDKVEEFRKMLEQTTPSKHRLKPNLSQDWINGLRKKIEQRNRR
jgi:hypothetical protein